MSASSPSLPQLAPWPDVDFSEFGDIEVRAQPKLQQITARALGRNWTVIPHVTHHDEADITQFEERRAAWNAAHPAVKITIVPVIGKIVAEALAHFPHFNASISADGQSLVLKRYFNVGFAIDSTRGLVVGVIRDCDRKSSTEIASELVTLASKANDRGLTYHDMAGGCMTISSLGHIGGTAFTPIVNAPEVAILGITKAQLRPAPSADKGISWRKMLPLSLSYDHRVINGADAARFVRFICDGLDSADILS